MNYQQNYFQKPKLGSGDTTYTTFKKTVMTFVPVAVYKLSGSPGKKTPQIAWRTTRFNDLVIPAGLPYFSP